MPRIRRVESRNPGVTGSVIPIDRAALLANQQAEAASALDRLLGEPRERKPTLLSPGRALREMHEMRTAGNWQRCRPVHLVALYCWCHQATYGVAPDELATGQAGKRARQAAVGAAKSMLVRDFGGSIAPMIGYIQWVWQRAREKEEWAARSGAKLGRISWQVMFAGRALLTDYKVEIGRRRAAR